MIIQPNSKLVFIGDSVTDYNRERPVGEGLGEAIGTSYVSVVDAMLKTAYPDYHIRVVNMGISGNTSSDLIARWNTDVMELNPDWIGILIGINDVWRQFDTPLMTETHIGLEAYEKNLENMIASVKSTVKGTVLMTPFFMEPNRKDAMRARMDEYGAVVKRLAEKHQTVFVDLQKAFDDYLHYYHPVSLNWDRIHPNQIGHMIISRAIAQAICLDFNRNPNKV